MKPDDPLLTPQEAAEYLRTKTGTLQWWRHVGRGPAFIKDPRILYRKSALDRHLDAAVREPTEVS